MVITSRQNPRIIAAAGLRNRRSRRETDCFLAEGLREVSRACQAGLALRELYYCPPLLNDTARVWLAGWINQSAEPPLEPQADAPAEHFEVTEPVLERMAYRDDPEGLIAVFEQRHWRLEQVLAERADGSVGAGVSGGSGACEGSGGLWLFACGSTKPGNVGAMARVAAGAGASGMVLVDAVVDLFNPNAIRASSGAVFSLPTAEADSTTLQQTLGERAITLIAADPSGELAYTDVDMTGPTAVIIGAEDAGMPDLWLAAARRHGCVCSISIMNGLIDSLNASTAAAVLLYEARRQRSIKA